MSKVNDHTIAEKRRMMYGLIASLCLQPPSDSLVSMIKDGSILQAFDGDEESTWYLQLAEYIDSVAKNPDLVNELPIEHTALFVLPSGVIPHEAVYCDKKKRLGGKNTMEVAQFYQRAGAEILEECIEMPDHLGIELQFMEFLCRIEKELSIKRQGEGLRECHNLQIAFLNDHLLQWVFQCCRDITRESENGFYKAIANLISDFLHGEKQYMAKLAAEYNNGRN